MGKHQKKIGAILRNINHRWFNRLSKEQQSEINKLFQLYKENFTKCNIELVDELNTGIEVKFSDFSYEPEKEKFNRAKEKENTRKQIEKGWFEWDDK